MGALLKSCIFLVILAVSYFVFAFGLSLVDLFASDVGLSSPATDTISLYFGYMLAMVSAAAVIIFFTIPATLSMFGHAAAWMKLLVVRSAKVLSVLLGTSLLLYLGARSVSAIGTGPDLTSMALPVIVLLVSGILVVGLLSRDALLKGGEAALDFAIRLPALFRFRHRSGESIAAVELTLTPSRQVREKREEANMQEEAAKFQRLARSFASLQCTTEFKLSFRHGRGRVLLLAKGRGGKPELEQRLLSVAKTYLPDARPTPVAFEEGPSLHGCSIMLSGPPEQAPNPLEPLARFFLENALDGDYAALLRSQMRNPISRVIARREQKKLAKESAQQSTSTSLSGMQTSTSVQDHFTQMNLEEAVRRVERRTSPQAVDAWVYVTAYGKSVGESTRLAETAAATVKASLSSHRGRQELKAHRLKRPFTDLSPLGRATIILPAEAAPLIWVPQVAMGMEIAPNTEFELPPAMEGEIELGDVVLQSGRSGHQARVSLDTLPKHVFVTGMTGSGKTTSCFNLLIQLHRHGVPFLVIEPVKSEYRSLSSVIPGLQVFTVGDEQTAPFRLNIFEPPSGVNVQTHMENLEAAWNASFVMYAPLPYVVKQVLLETYRACGWDVGKNSRGRPITLDDFETVARSVSRKLGYEPNVTMDIEAALRARITSLSLGSKRAVFNASSSIPLETILRRPTIIELKSVPNNEEKAFLALLILSNLFEYLEVKGQSRQLRHMTLIEEAHRMLPNVSTTKGDPEAADPRKTMVEQFANMLAEVRAFGEGLAIVEQIPTKILPDAIKNTATKVAHRVPAADDREVLAGAMNLTQEQASAFTALQPGEAIVHLQRHPLPIRVAVPNVTEKLGVPVGEIGDDEVKRLMTDFYLRNPLPRAPQSVLNEKLLLTVEADWFKAKFREAYNEWLETGSTATLATLLIQSAAKLSDDREETLLIASKFLKLASERHLRFDLEKNEFPTAFMRSIEKSMRNAKRAG